MIAKIFILAVLALFINLGIAAAQQTKPYSIGVVSPGGPMQDTINGLRQGLKELGFTEGKQFTSTITNTKGDTEAAGHAAKQFEGQKFDLVFAIASTVIAAAKEATTSIPIVFCIGADPVALGLVNGFARPGGRLTGVHYLVRDLTAKRLAILKEILPKASRVVTYYNPTTRIAAEGAALARAEGKRLGIKILERHVKSSAELRKGLETLKAGEADAFFYIPDAMVVGEAQLVIDSAGAIKLPTMLQDESLVAQGGLASYGQSYHEIGRLAAKYVQRVLTGTQPKDLKIETFQNTDLTINLKTARELDITIPPQVLARATKVIK